MYAHLRLATSPACFLCTHLSRFRSAHLTCKRGYAAQAALASIPAGSRRVEPGPIGEGSSSVTNVQPSRKSLCSGKGPSKLDPAARAERVNQKAREHAARVGRKALKVAQEAERRRKAFATLDKTTKFIAAGKETPHEPTLADLERIKPKQPPLITLKFIYPEPSSRLHRGSPDDSVVERYSATFQELVDILSKRFRRKQLLKLYKEGSRIRTDTLRGTPKPLYDLRTTHAVAEEIVRWLWHWPYVKDVKERKAYLTTRSNRAFPIDTNEFFLLLGPDGSSLLALTESHGVIVTKVERTKDAFTLVVEGPNYKLDHLAVILAERKKTITSELIRVDSMNQTSESSPGSKHRSVRPDLIPRISKLSNAHVEDKGNGMFRISAHHKRNIAMAVRLVTRASQQAALPPPPLLVHLPTQKDSTPSMMFPHAYALFPFEMASKDTSPWIWTSTGILSRSPALTHDPAVSQSAIAAPSSGAPCLFRARKVSEWLAQDPTDSVRNARGLKEGVGRLLSSSGQPHTLREALGLPGFDFSRPTESSQRKITASTGHIVFSAALGLHSSFSPPLRGSWVFSEFMDWMKADKGRVAFIPSPPQPLINYLPIGQTTLHRLIYRSRSPMPVASSTLVPGVFVAQPSRTLKFAVVLPQSVQGKGGIEAVADSDTRPEQVGGRAFGTIVRSMYDDECPPSGQYPAHDGESIGIPPKPDLVSMPPTSVSTDGRIPSKSSARLWTGVETFVNVMLPDRPMDMQISSFESNPVPTVSEPEELREYASNLTRHLTISDSFTPPDPPLCVTCFGIQYVLDENATVRWSAQVPTDDSTREEEAPIDAVIENIVDLENNQNVFACQVTCSDTDALSGWQNFLGDCDRMTWLTAKKGALSAPLLDKAYASDPDEIS